MNESGPLLQRAQLRGLLITTGMGAGLVTWAHFSFNAFLLIVIPAVSGIVCVFQIVIHGVWFALKKKVHNRQQALAGIVAAAVCTATVFGIQRGQDHLLTQLEQQLAPVIPLLAAYHDANDKYPKQLSEVLPNPPRCPDDSDPYLEKDGDYCLVCITVGFTKHQYCSDKPQWQSWD